MVLYPSARILASWAVIKRPERGIEESSDANGAEESV